MAAKTTNAKTTRTRKTNAAAGKPAANALNVERIIPTEITTDEKIGEGAINVSTNEAVTNAGSNVIVCFNSPYGVKFRLRDKSGKEIKVIEVAGNAQKLIGATHGVIPVGEFGKTTVSAEDWKEIIRQNGKMTIFASGNIFAADTEEEANAMIAERRGLRHGFEPVDVTKTVTEPGSASAV